MKSWGKQITGASGLAFLTKTPIGNETKLGKIGKSLETIQEEKTPLELQINNFVKKMVIVGVTPSLLRNLRRNTRLIQNPIRYYINQMNVRTFNP
ncbi:hypothetical protein [Algoriphagus aquimarinus]|uniref:hypothetical protein n=1 Tax=Algoriphagus aquimarinus TaxID=237018 RepID=UPI0030DD2151